MRPPSLKQNLLLLVISMLNCLGAIVYSQAANDFGTKDRINNGFEGDIYALSPDTRMLPDFDTLTSLGKIYTRELNIPGRNWTDGFPGVTDRFEWFGLEYKATIRANEKGRYTFKLLSDDGSRLYVDDSLLIDNDGLHGQVEESGTIDLDKNTHQITVQYFQGPRFMIALQLFVKKDNSEQVIFPGKDFALTTPASKRLVPNIYLWLLVLLFIVVVIIFLRRRRKNEEKQLTSGQAG